MAFSPADLRLIICEDEFLLATELAQQCEALGAKVVARVASLAELNGVLISGVAVNAAVLDVQLLDGEVYSAVPRLEDMGIALAFCTAYLAQDCPPQCAHIPWFGKLAPARDILDALCAARGAGRHDHHD